MNIKVKIPLYKCSSVRVYFVKFNFAIKMAKIVSASHPHLPNFHHC